MADTGSLRVRAHDAQRDKGRRQQTALRVFRRSFGCWFMTDTYLLGLDFGTESARGVRISLATGKQEASASRSYPNNVLSRWLPTGRALPEDYALQVAHDYLDIAEALLKELGGGRDVAGIGIDFTASSPLPAKSDGTPLSQVYPDNPHAYVKLWRHHAAQSYAQAMDTEDGVIGAHFGGRVSAEWMLAKAAQSAEEDPALWAETDRFIEAGDWLVWMLTGKETRSLDFAAYKAQFLPDAGYPSNLVPDLADKLSSPHRVGTSAGPLAESWRERTGILGQAAVAVAVIDSHAVLPAAQAGRSGTLTCAIGTSAAYLYLTDTPKALPRGVEGMAADSALPGLWCYEAGQAAYGDLLGWFVRRFPLADDIDTNFARYTEAVRALPPGGHGLIALDWWSGNRVPYSDSALSGTIVGMTLETDGADIYRALMESLCYGTRTVVDMFERGGLPVERVVVTSGLSTRNPLLVQIMADVLAREIDVPQIANATCVGAAIHGAVAAGVCADFSSAQARFAAAEFKTFTPDAAAASAYGELYAAYGRLAETAEVREAMHALRRIGRRSERAAESTGTQVRNASLVEEMSDR